MKILALCLTVLLTLHKRATAEECKAGDVWADQKIKMQCVDDGTKPIACLPTGKIGEQELKPGEQYSSTSFKFQCNAKSDWELSYDAIACILPDGKELAIGATAGVANKGVYNCVKNADGSISRKVTAGCYFDGKLYTPGQTWTSGSGQITCAGGAGNYEAKASGCLLPNGEVIQLGGYAEQDNAHYKCQGNGQLASQADLVKVSEAEYQEWWAGQAGAEEEAAGGDSGAGYTKRPKTPRPANQPAATHPPSPPPQDGPTDLPGTQQPPATHAPSQPPATQPPPPQTHAPVTPFQTRPPQVQCQDLHPICETLCQRSCAGPSRPAHQQDQPIGLAIENDKHRFLGLGGFLFGSHSHSRENGKPCNHGDANVKPSKPVPGKPGFGGSSAPANIGGSKPGAAFGGAAGAGGKPGLSLGMGVGKPGKPSFGGGVQGGGQWSNSWSSSWGGQGGAGTGGNFGGSFGSGGFGIGNGGGGGFPGFGGSFGSGSFGGFGGSGASFGGAFNNGFSSGFNGGFGGGGSGGGKPGKPGKPSKPGKPGKHSGGKHSGGSSSSSSSSSESKEGHGHGKGHGHGHGHGHAHGHGHGNQGGGSFGGSFGSGFGSGGFGGFFPGHPGGPNQCFDLADSSVALVNALCPRSCGACGKPVDLQRVAVKWASSSCAGRNPQPPIGPAVDPKPPAPAPSPVQPPQPQPHRPPPQPQQPAPHPQPLPQPLPHPQPVPQPQHPKPGKGSKSKQKGSKSKGKGKSKQKSKGKKDKNKKG